ncbi:hypothetical protein GCM10010919_16880 [Alishewanella longhuensis]|uniref:MSHA biogenesis protein MshI n=1 Tax=Alishewanella longhuensis TaxID=1091037 RepID=A0ABQ3KYQ8_9ALTE|nr:hypothetical protein [Alishewanella longhuensis]GHG67865.1 hypothetical protein GCM10010919_16880 [Alishewanella longhuensis]
MLQQFLRKWSRGSTEGQSLLVLHVFNQQIKLLHAERAKQGWQLRTEQLVGETKVFPENMLQILSSLPPSGEVAVVLSPELYQIIPLDKPNLPTETELLQALPWLLKDLCPLAPEEMQLDYLDLTATAGAPAKINVVVAAKSSLQQLCEYLQQAKLGVTHIFAEELLSRDLVPVQGPTRLVLQQQPNNDLILQVMRDGQLCFSRHLRGFQQFLATPVTQLQFGLFDNLLLEVQRSMDFVEGQLKLPPVREVLLLMAHPELEALPALFHQAGFNQVRLMPLPEPWSWASQVDLQLWWPAIVAMATLMQTGEPSLEAAG